MDYQVTWVTGNFGLVASILSYIYIWNNRSTPVECLHTILLGASKYLLRSFMDKRSASEKKQLLARIAAFSYSGFSVRITGNIAYHYRSFVGRDYKAFMQMAIFIVSSFISNEERKCWLLLSKVCIGLRVVCYNNTCRCSRLLTVIL